MIIAVYETGMWDEHWDVVRMVDPPDYKLVEVSDELTHEEISTLVERMHGAYHEYDPGLYGC